MLSAGFLYPQAESRVAGERPGPPATLDPLLPYCGRQISALVRWWKGGVSVTVDEELTLLEDTLRKLKIEYDAFFGGGLKRPPGDTEWRVRSLINKYSDGRSLNFQQLFRYNALAQKFAVFSDLWRKKLRIKEEGYRRPQDALLSIQGLRTDQEHAAARAMEPAEKRRRSRQPVELEFSNPPAEAEKAHLLFQALVQARERAGIPAGGNFESFQEFLTRKTADIRAQFGCASVEYAVAVDGDQVKLKAKAKK
jgi:hypothetical protein